MAATIHNTVIKELNMTANRLIEKIPALAAAGLLSSIALFTTGCADNSQAHYVDSNGPGTVVNVHEINIQDFNNAGQEMVNSLLTSGVLDSAPRKPAIMAISRITNETDQEFDTDLLVKNIRVALSQSGKVRTSTTVGLGGQAEDPLAKGTQQQQEFYGGTSNQMPDLPDFTLSGKIIQTNANAGDVRQATYTFQLSLTDKSGNAAWEDQKQITKQGTHSGVGW
jgi:penicillin-binding protein activator